MIDPEKLVPGAVVWVIDDYDNIRKGRVVEYEADHDPSEGRDCVCIVIASPDGEADHIARESDEVFDARSEAVQHMIDRLERSSSRRDDNYYYLRGEVARLQKELDDAKRSLASMESNRRETDARIAMYRDMIDETK